jgi:hypothetical protein
VGGIVGPTISVPYAWFARLLKASRRQREAVEIGRFGLHWADIDEDISISSLLAGPEGSEVNGGERRGAGQIMALIKSFEHKSMDRNSIHDEIVATTTTFEVTVESSSRSTAMVGPSRKFPARRVKRFSWMRSPLASYLIS